MRSTTLGGPSSSRGRRRESTQFQGTRSPEIGLTMIANDLGIHPDILAAALLTSIEAVRTLSADPQNINFEDNSSTGTAVTSVTLSATTTSKTVQCMSSSVGYFVEYVEVAITSSGTIDDAAIQCVVSGVGPNDLTFLVASGEVKQIPFNRIITQSHDIGFWNTGISGTDTIVVNFAAIGSRPDAGYRQRARQDAVASGQDVTSGYSSFQVGVKTLATEGLSAMVQSKRAQAAALKASQATGLNVTTADINPLGTFLGRTAG